MSYFAITAQYPIFSDLDGTPLENGYVYIGTKDENPITDPITVYWDSNLQIPATQPIRTIAGAPSRSGKPGTLFCSTDFSIIIQNKNQETIFSAPYGFYIFTDTQLYQNRNLLINGDFEARNRHWLACEQNAGLQVGYSYFEAGQALVSNNPSTFISFSSSNLTNASDTYGRFTQPIEGVYQTQNKTFTLSFWFTAANQYHNKIAISFTQHFAGDDTDVTGIGAEVIDIIPSEETPWQRVIKQINIPSIASKNLDPNTDRSEYALYLNIWACAGSDYNNQTSGLDNVSDLVSNLVGVTGFSLADVQFEEGPIVTDFDRIHPSYTIGMSERYYETTYEIERYPAIGTKRGSVTFISPGVSTTIPGFRFRTLKRKIPSVNIYSYNDNTIDTVYQVGVGNIAVSSVNDISPDGFGSITLSSATVANNIYKYHWVADAEYQCV